MTLCSSHRLRTATAAVTHVAVGFSEWWLWNNTLNSKPDRGQKLELPLCEPKLNLMKRRISQLSLCLFFFFLPKWHLWLWNCILLHIFILIWLKVHLFMFTLHCTGCQCFYACVHGLVLFLWKYWSLYGPVWGLHSGSKTYKLVDSCPPHTPLSPGDTDALIPWKNRLLLDAFLWFVRSKALFYRE